MWEAPVGVFFLLKKERNNIIYGKNRNDKRSGL